MVDFGKRIGKKALDRLVDPIELYTTLDRASDKGPLRAAQERVLSDWHLNKRHERDVILKLHTGQGKTLLGLLMLQSKLNEGTSPALYLCPNHFLVKQTVAQAEQFGINCVTFTDELPDEFVEGRAISVTVAQKLFNGLTKFQLGSRSLRVGSVLIDDAHACVDSIRKQFQITLRQNVPNESTAYSEILGLFENELRRQGDGSFEDILRNDYSSYLPIPYWDWSDKTSEVAGILSRNAGTNAVKFAWPLLKDSLASTLCLVSGTQIVIAPYSTSLEQFGSYSRAKNRIFMSASVIDDSFLIKGFGLAPDTIRSPITDPLESWSGEKMVLIPSQIDESLVRTKLVKEFAAIVKGRNYGVVGLVPSAQCSVDWKNSGAKVVDKDSIKKAVDNLRERAYDETLVLVNYYDGIDLPDNVCRILVSSCVG